MKDQSEAKYWMSNPIFIAVIAFTLRVVIIVLTTFIETGYLPYLTALRYTDIDYHVYSDAARYITEGQSPYERFTYRYPPLLAILMVPNIKYNYQIGKVIFSLFDSLIVYMIYLILEESNMISNTANSQNSSQDDQSFVREPVSSGSTSSASSWLWALNPVSINICTRGSSDAISNLGILLYIHLIHKDYVFVSGILFGVLIYWRLYPIIYLPAVLAHLVSGENTSKSIFAMVTVRNLKVILMHSLAIVISCGLLGFLSYTSYGPTYLDQSVLYHLSRKDFRHNFSVYFLSIYMQMSKSVASDELSGNIDGVNLSMLFKIIDPMLTYSSIVIQLVLIISVSYLVLQRKMKLVNCMFIQTLIFVVFNKVITAQYFTWFMCFLPIIFGTKNRKIEENYSKLLWYMIIWSITCGFWLYNAYCLEFLGLNRHLSVWMASVMFHLANVKCIIDFVIMLTK